MEYTQSMSVSEAIASRFACRDFLPKEVPLDLIMKILDEARRAPSSGNLQPWKIYLVHGENKKKLTKIIKTKTDSGVFIDLPLAFTIYPSLPPIPTTSGFSNKFKQIYPKYYQRYANMGKLIYTSQGVARNDQKKRMEKAFRGYDFFGAPVGLILTIDEGFGYGQYPDLGILLQSIMLLCQQYGLNTCPLVMWSLQHATVKKALNIGDNEKVFCGMAIGYKNDKAPVNQFKIERMPLDEMVTIAEVNENIKIESTYVFKAKLAMSMTKYYMEQTLPCLTVMLGAVAIGTAYWFRKARK